MLQCDAVCCSVMQFVAVYCGMLHQHCKTEAPVTHMNVLQRVAACCGVFKKEVPVTNTNVLQHMSACCSMLQSVAVCCSVLQCVAVCCSTTHYNTFICVTGAAVLKFWCNTLHQTATRCNTLQHVHTCNRRFCFCNSSAKHCNTLKFRCNTLQHTTTRSRG